jgi:molybdopterin-dependent oxidoreductase alpha subunit
VHEQTKRRHEIQRTRRDRLLALIPFGLGRTKPKHFRDMMRVVWKNRDNLPYAWKVLSRGVCDGCALGVAGFHDWTITGTHLCMTRLNLLRLNTMSALDPRRLERVAELESFDNEQLRELGRLPYPMLRETGDAGFRRISWDEANARIAQKIRATSPKRLAFFVTARGVTNEVYYVAQKAARAIGTNNVDNAARICHSPSTSAMKDMLGVAATTCSYKDWWGTDLIIFFGSNPANDQPVTTKYLHEAKLTGAKVVMVNPYREPGMDRYWIPSTLSSAIFGTGIADYWFPVSQGGDIGFLYGALKSLIETGGCDEAFVQNHTSGFSELAAACRALDWVVLEQLAGLPRASMEEFAALIRSARKGVLVWSMGITQHARGADGVRMILNLGLAKGWVGRDHCGLMPIRGHSSVQGGAEMGAYSTALPGGLPVTPENAAALSAQYGFTIPSEPGMTTTEMIHAAERGELDVLYALGGNFLRNLPEPERVRDALQNVPLRVHQDIILTDQMLIPAKEAVLLLPAKTRYEQDGGGIETITERRIVFSPEIPRQVGEARAEWRILRDLALAVRPELANCFGCDSGDAIRAEIARVVPFYDGIQNLRKTGDAIQYGGPHLCAGGNFPLPDGRARFRPVELPATESRAGKFHVSTRRGKQFNSLIYAQVDPLTGANRDAVFMNAEDAGDLRVNQGDTVLLRNPIGELHARVFLAPIARGNLQVHWPEGNVIIRRGREDRDAGVPDYNALVEVIRYPEQT